MSKRNCELVGLLGFVLAGFFYIAAGVRSGDALTTIGSVVWTVACLIWMIPLVRKV